MRKSCLINTLVSRPLNTTAYRLLGSALALLLVSAWSTGCYVFRDFDPPPEQRDASVDIEPPTPDTSDERDVSDATVDSEQDVTDTDRSPDTPGPGDRDAIEDGSRDVGSELGSRDDVVEPVDTTDDTHDNTDDDIRDGDDDDDDDGDDGCLPVGSPNEASFYCGQTQSTCGNITVIDDCGTAHNVQCGTCQDGATCLGDSTTFPRECACDCEIAGECIAAGTEKSDNPCLVCDPSESQTHWTPEANKSCGQSPSCSCNPSGSCTKANGRDC